MNTIEKIQQELIPWQAHNFPDRTYINPLLGMTEELGELNHHILKRMQKIRMNENHDEGIKDSCADLIIFMCDFCNAEGIDLDKELRETWEKVSKRDWKANNHTGVKDSAPSHS